MTSDATAPRRATYRHGDLRRALVEAGTALARAGGPDAVVLREVTRQVGVAPNAAYRHFADRAALLQAVVVAAQVELAEAMGREIDAVPADLEPVAAARAQLRAVGTGYLRFARAEPGLFRTAFWVPADLSGANDPDRGGARGRSPFATLGDALDALVACGALPPERRPAAEFLAWSSVHGLAQLRLDGPLRGLDDDVVEHVAGRLLDMVERGL